MDTVSDTCHGAGHYLFQSGVHHFYGLPGYIGGWIYVFTFIYLLTYVGVICLNLFWLFSRYLLKRHYMVYLSLLSVAMIVALLIQMIIEYLAYSYWPQLHARGSYFSVPMLMDYISSFMLSTLCMIGGTMTVLLKEWMIENRRVSQMEKAHALSEVEQLKEQVSPELLFKTLHHSGELTLTEPEKASEDVDEIEPVTTLSVIRLQQAQSIT